MGYCDPSLRAPPREGFPHKSSHTQLEAKKAARPDQRESQGPKCRERAPPEEEGAPGRTATTHSSLRRWKIAETPKGASREALRVQGRRHVARSQRTPRPSWARLTRNRRQSRCPWLQIPALPSRGQRSAARGRRTRYACWAANAGKGRTKPNSASPNSASPNSAVFGRQWVQGQGVKEWRYWVQGHWVQGHGVQ